MTERKEMIQHRLLLEDVHLSLTTQTRLSTLYRLQHCVQLSRTTEVSEKLSTIKAPGTQWNIQELSKRDEECRTT